jgi:N-methylhydantoinase A
VLKLSADLVYANQLHALTVPLGEADLDNWPGLLCARFQDSYRARYGYYQPDQPVHIRALRLAAVGRLARPGLLDDSQEATLSTSPAGERAIYLGEWIQAYTYRLEGLSPGKRLSGPAVVDGDYTTVLLPPGCKAEVDPWKGLIIDAY